MASRTQLRMAQITGSFSDIKSEVVAYAAPATAASLTGSDLNDVVGALAAAVQRIHGASSDEVFNQAEGRFDTTTFDVNSAGVFTVDGVGASNVTTNGALTVSGSTGLNLHSHSGEIDITSTQHDIDINSTAKNVNIDAGKAVSLDAADSSNFTVDNATKNLKLQVKGGGAQKLQLDSAGTGTDAIDINATAGGIDIDAGGAIDVDSSAAITIGGTNATSLTLGRLGQTITINGNLDINGDTTTIDSANTQFEDSIIGLGISGSDSSFNNAGDRAIIFAKSANAHDALPALNWTGTQFELAKYLAKPASGAMGNADSFADLKVNNLTLVGGLALPDSNASHTLTLEANGGDLTGNRTLDFVVNDANRTLTIEADSIINQDLSSDNAPTFTGIVSTGDMTLDSAGDIILDADGADVFFKDAGTTIGKITNSSNALIISGGNGAAFTLDANSGELHFDKGGERYASILKDGTGFELTTKATGNNSFKIAAQGTGAADLFGGGGDGGLVRFGLGGTHILNMTASEGHVQIRAGAGGSDANDIIFTNENFGVELARFDTSAHSLALPQQNAAGNDAGAGILSFNGTTDVNEAIYSDGSFLYLRSNAVNFRLPNAAAATSGFALVADGTAGNLTFAAVGSDAVTKGIKIVDADGVSAGTAVNFNAVDAGSTVSGLAKTEAQGKSLDVYVNGQLLVSGSTAQRTSGDRDYEVHSGTELKFAFDLEVDDVIQLIKR